MDYHLFRASLWWVCSVYLDKRVFLLSVLRKGRSKCHRKRTKAVPQKLEAISLFQLSVVAGSVRVLMF